MTQQDDRTEAEKRWAAAQRRINNSSTALTAVGAGALGATLAGKTKLAGKVLPKRAHKALNTARADDIRNTIALASMTSGVLSGIHWSGKLKRDADPEAAKRDAAAKAKNLAKAMSGDIAEDIAKRLGVPGGIRRATRVRLPRGGMAMRRSSYSRAPMPRPRRTF